MLGKQRINSTVGDTLETIMGGQLGRPLATKIDGHAVKTLLARDSKEFLSPRHGIGIANGDRVTCGDEGSAFGLDVDRGGKLHTFTFTGGDQTQFLARGQLAGHEQVEGNLSAFAAFQSYQVGLVRQRSDLDINRRTWVEVNTW